MSKPTIVIVPGAWQTPLVWDAFRATVEKAGYPPSIHVPLPTIGGTQIPLPGLSEDVVTVRNVLEPLIEQGKEVVLLCHSSGGLIGSNAVEGFDAVSRKAAGKTSGGVVRIVFVAAFLLPKGRSLLPGFAGREAAALDESRDVFPQIGFNDLPPEDRARWAKEATHTSASLFSAPWGHEPWANGTIPCSYIFCSADNALLLAFQQGMVQQLGLKPRTATLERGHCPFLSMPDEMLKALQSVV
ncbi:Alpha/beta hydrolase fold-1 [Coniochaeta sp. 2T2.1]|nr:Alpha/beta hydrolase fold-1 [Coniochaeta sp. 2T2.1]